MLKPSAALRLVGVAQRFQTELSSDPLAGVALLGVALGLDAEVLPPHRRAPLDEWITWGEEQLDRYSSLPEALSRGGALLQEAMSSIQMVQEADRAAGPFDEGSPKP